MPTTGPSVQSIKPRTLSCTCGSDGRPVFFISRSLRNISSHAPRTELYGSRRRFLPALFFA